MDDKILAEARAALAAGDRLVRDAASPVFKRGHPNENILRALNEVLKSFEDGLSPDEELGIYVGNLPSPFNVRSIRKKASELLLFEGVDEDSGKVVALQQVSQLGFQLIAARKAKPTAYRVGFIQNNEAVA